MNANKGDAGYTNASTVGIPIFPTKGLSFHCIMSIVPNLVMDIGL